MAIAKSGGHLMWKTSPTVGSFGLTAKVKGGLSPLLETCNVS